MSDVSPAPLTLAMERGCCIDEEAVRICAALCRQRKDLTQHCQLTEGS
jgi:hypothetical protein